MSCVFVGVYLKDCEQSVDGRVKVWRGSPFLEVERTPEELHPEQGEDEDEQEEKEQEGHNGREGVH